MTSSAKPQTSEGSKNHPIFSYIVIAISILVMVLSFFSRIKISDFPLTRDEGSYGYLGKMAMQGKIPYLEIFEMKPPMLFYFYGLGGKIFGTHDLGLRYLALFLTALSSFFLYKLIKKYSTTGSSMLAASSYAFFSLNMYCFGFSMVAEHFINAILLGLGLIILDRDSKNYMILLAGFLFGLAVLTKQTMALFLPLFLIILWLKSENKKLKRISFFLTGGIVSLMLLFMFLISTNALESAKFWLIDYSSAYTESISVEKGKQYFTYFLKNIFNFSPLIFFVSILGILSSFINIKTKNVKLFLIYMISAFVTIIPGLRFYGQYWIILLPALSMGLAYLIDNTSKLNFYFGTGFSILIGILFFIEFSSKKQYYFANKVPKQMEKLYEGNPFEAIKNISQYASKIMKPSDKLMILGSEPQIYLYTNKIAPSNHVYLGFLSRNIKEN
ncbi:MAG: hypothetical protein RLZZ546_3204, partial [Bacteroidota bacterium]